MYINTYMIMIMSICIEKRHGNLYKWIIYICTYIYIYMYIYMHADSQIHVSDMTHLTQAHTGCIDSDLFQDTKESTCVTLTNSWG